MSRNVRIIGIDGNTGFTIAELLLSDPFKTKVDSVVGLALDPTAEKAKEFQMLEGRLVTHRPGRARNVVQTLRETGCDVLCLVPPACRDKIDVANELVNATKRVGIANLCLLSSVGCDYADP